jgi:phage shock protein A
MTSFVNKLRVVTLGTVHDLLDKAIDLNSPSALRQYTRDLEDALDKMRNEAAIQAGQIRTMERERDDLTAKIETSKVTIVKLRETGHEDLARIKATEVVRMQTQVGQLTSNLANQRVASAQLDSAVTKLDGKHADIVSRIRDLERMDRDTKAKEQTAQALSAAGRLVGTGADLSVDDIQQRMQARNDVATEKFNRAMGDVKVEDDPETTAAVDDLLNELKPHVEAKTA